MLKKQSVLMGLAMFATIGYSSTAASYESNCSISYIMYYAATCKSIVQDLYVADTNSCSYYTAGGTAAGAGGLGGAALLGSNPYGLAALGVGAIGTGIGAWGASACYSDSAAVKEQNLATCDVITAKITNTCEEQKEAREGSSTGNSGGGGSNTGDTGHNSGQYNGYRGYSVCGTACKKGTVDIH